MALIAICVVGFCVLIVGLVRMKQSRDRRETEQHSIDAEALHALLIPERRIQVFDVRQPLDLLAYSEIIPGATRIPPKEIEENVALIPKEMDSVIYCTCVSEKTSRAVIRRAREMEFTRVKYLRGGLAGWKAKGYPVERYEKPFHLDTAT